MWPKPPPIPSKKKNYKVKTTYRKTSDRSRAPNRRRAPHTGRGV